ncbi:MAG TPA: hypothetical protein VFN10_02590 [Thermoanaerobaculia bacterium]|nr:hypothetical protein [Thermoanaerobaculia bacterium]
MSDSLSQILSSLKQQRADLQRDLDSTDVSATRTTELLQKLDELRSRAALVAPRAEVEK